MRRRYCWCLRLYNVARLHFEMRQSRERIVYLILARWYMRIHA